MGGPGAMVEEPQATDDDREARDVESRDVAISLERQRREVELGRERLDAVLAAIRDGVLVVDSEARPRFANDGYRRMFGDPERPLAVLGPDGEELPADQNPHRRAARGESFETTFTMRDATGATRWLEATARPIPSLDGPLGVLVVRDITDTSLRRLQEEFVAIASHELRTPLTALHGYVQLIARHARDGANDTTAEYAERALAESRRLTELVEDLLDLARIRSGRLVLDLEPTDLRPIVERSIEIARTTARRQRIGLHVGDGRFIVDGDPGRLEQVLLNLVGNAIEHSGSDEIDVRLEGSDGVAHIHVEDHGRGIPVEHLPSLADRFPEAARGSSRAGLGLGLYISREIVTGHGGSLDIHSEVGRGTTATVTLPLR